MFQPLHFVIVHLISTRILSMVSHYAYHDSISRRQNISSCYSNNLPQYIHAIMPSLHALSTPKKQFDEPKATLSLILFVVSTRFHLICKFRSLFDKIFTSSNTYPKTIYFDSYTTILLFKLSLYISI
jgi:hypothetical protein